MNKSLLDLIELPTLAVAHTRNTTQFRGCYDNVPILYYYLNCTWMFETNLFIPWVVVSCIAWHILELVVRLISYRLSVFKSIEDKNDSLRWHNKIVSYIHAWLSTIIGAVALLQEESTWYDAKHGYAPRYELVLAITVGYFIFDLLFYFRYKHAFGENTSMVIHHVVCIVSVFFCIVYRIGVFYNVTLLLTEVTTILLHQQWFLSVLGYKNGVLYQANGLLFWLMFFFCRVVWCFLHNVHLYHFNYQFEQYAYILRIPIIVPSILFLLNLYWFVLITKRILVHGGKSPNSSDKNKNTKSVDQPQIGTSENDETTDVSSDENGLRKRKATNKN